MYIYIRTHTSMLIDASYVIRHFYVCIYLCIYIHIYNCFGVVMQHFVSLC